MDFTYLVNILLIHFICLTQTKPQCQNDQSERAVGRQTGRFGWNLQFLVSKQGHLDKNTVYSPLAIYIALATLDAGTTGETQAEIKRLLDPSGNLNLDPSKWIETLHHVQGVKDDDRHKLDIANGFFYSDALTIKPEFLQNVGPFPDTRIDKSDFDNNTEGARISINEWVREKTSRKIHRLLDDGTVDCNTVGVLANAAYLKIPWAASFQKSEELPFYSFGGNESDLVSFMVREGDYPYAEAGGIQLLQIPFDKSADLSMYIVLPKARSIDWKDVEEEALYALNDTATITRVKVKIPKFKLQSKFDLKHVLKRIGIKKIFTDQAEFSPMFEQSLKISTAVGAYVIKVSESGTEGTEINKPTALPPSSAPPSAGSTVEFTADHPFLFGILHNHAQTMVLCGKVIDIIQ